MTDIQRRDSLESLKTWIKALALEVKPPGEFFTLKSGAKSRYYLDCRRLTLHSYGLRCVIDCISGKLEELDSAIRPMTHRIAVGGKIEFDAVGGPCVGADPIVGGVLSHVSRRFSGEEIRGFLVRKEEKDHGKSGRIIGSVKPGDKCVLFEDVTTSGGSSIDAVDAIETFGCKVVLAISIIDRLAGARDVFAARGIPFHPLLTIEDLGMVE